MTPLAAKRETIKMEDKPAAAPASPAPRPPVSEIAMLAKPARRKFRFRLFAVLFCAVLLVVAVCLYYFHFIAPYESTDDAFVEGNVAFISPRVSGPIVKLLVNDNQRVKAGDPLVEIDAQDYETLAAQAKADLAVAVSRVEQARVQIIVDQAKADQQLAAVVSAEAIAVRAEADRQRFESVPSQAVSRTQFDLAKSTATSSTASVDVARNQAKAAQAQVELDKADVATAESQVEQAKTRLQQAELNLSYTRLAAPRDGRVTRRTVEQGAYVQTGQALLAIVPDEVWVVANFKETQLSEMRAGQPVSITVDAYPKREFKGHVDSLQAGAGARFSLLPPENAVGNYVKVVQRVPVKILFDEPLNDPGLDIAPGMSVVPRVKIK
jgi:membrane fusion protein (multidrug efflux system)